MSETDRFDSMLLTITQSQRGIEPLLDTVFSFLRRKTDFFSGAEPHVIENTILTSVRKQASLMEKEQLLKKHQEAKKRQKQQTSRKAAELEKKQKKDPVEEVKSLSRFEEITDEDATESKETKPTQKSLDETRTSTTEAEEHSGMRMLLVHVFLTT